MKKKYMTPTMKVVELSQKHFLLTSQIEKKMKVKAKKEDGYEIYYDGVDDDGELDPD